MKKTIPKKFIILEIKMYRKLSFNQSLLILLLFLFSLKTAICQTNKVIYYSSSDAIVNSIEQADLFISISDSAEIIKGNYYRKWDEKWQLIKTEVVTKINDTCSLIKVMKKEKLEETIHRKYKQLSDSIYEIIDSNEISILSKGFSKQIYPLVEHGKYFYFYENNRPRKESEFINGIETSNKRWNRDGSEGYSNVFNGADVMPRFPGGDNQLFFELGNRLRYPKKAKKANQQGTVYISFIILEDGSMAEINIYKGVFPELDQEALRVVEELNIKWSLGYINNKVVRVGFTLPITFKLQN